MHLESKNNIDTNRPKLLTQIKNKMRASGYSPKTIEPYTHVINQGPGIKSPLDG